MTEEAVVQLGPFPIWTQQAAMSGSVLPSCALPEHGNCFSSNPNEGETWCRSFVPPSERDFGSSAAVGCKPQRTPCAMVSAFPLGSDCCDILSQGDKVFSWPSRTGIPHHGDPQMHTGSCLPSPWVTGVSVLQCSLWFPGVAFQISKHTDLVVCCVPADFTLKYRSAPSYSSFSPVALVAGVIQLLRILQQLSVFLQFLFAHVSYWKVCVI